MLQTRNKGAAHAAIKIACDLVEGLITKEEALLKIDPTQLDSYCIHSLTLRH